MTRRASIALIAFLELVAFLGLSGCARTSSPRVLYAEFLDDGVQDGRAAPDETIRVVLDAPLPRGLRPEAIRVRAVPPTDWSARIEPTPDPRVLAVRILAGTPDFRFRGLHGRDPAATGLEIEFGDGAPQTVDLQLADSLPVLERVFWHDSGEPRGNRVVDQGDFLRLVFDRPVKLEVPPGEAARVRCPQDVILRKRGIDRLDDGDLPACFSPGVEGRETEVLIVLGSNPFLFPGGGSGLALNGTRLFPHPGIVDRRGGRGAVSLEDVDIECEPEMELPRALEGLRFPDPGGRIFHSLVPVAGGRAVVAGGAAAANREALDQILIFDPFLWREGRRSAFVRLQARLPRPSYHHTATLLPGADRVFLTADDLILVAGGTDGARVSGDLTVLRLREDGGLDVERLRETLAIPRAEHAAVALPGNRVLIDGGRSSGTEGPSGLVGCAEVIAIDPAARPARISSRYAFRSIARMRHTLTVLAPAARGESLVLAYGGYGDPRRDGFARAVLGEDVAEPAPQDVFFSTDDGAVLASPALIDPAAPRRSPWKLPCGFDPAFLRWGHAAVPLRSAPPTTPRAEETLGCDAVLLAGGTARHVLHGFDGGPFLWEMPLETYLRRPKPSDAAGAVLFRFQRDDPASSAFVALPYPEPEESLAADRVFASALEVPDRAVWILGGESPRGEGASAALATGQAFSRDAERLAPLAVRLAERRTRHQAYLVDMAGVRSIFLVGGVPGGSGVPDDYPAVEEIPLPR
ncbi:MAG: hypothetical protein ACUVYA_14330 [Planctomycetota bacterium]